MILNREDALYAANVFIDYFQNFGRIDDYLRRVKLERMSNYPTSLPGMGPQDDMFDDFSMHPNDMDFVCREVTTEIFVIIIFFYYFLIRIHDKFCIISFL